MPYTPQYRYIPPFNRDSLTPWYDASCALIGLGRRFKEKVLNSLTLADGGTVADIGCGTGVLLEAVKKKFPHIRAVGVDPDARALAIAKRRLRKHELTIELIRGYAEKLPLSDAFFDAVFSTLMLHHLPEDIKRKAIVEMHRILKPGGQVVIADFGSTHGFWLKKILRFFERVEYLRGNFEGLIPKYLQDAGFVRIEEKGRHFPKISIMTAHKM